MQNHARERALVLLEIAKRSPVAKDRALYLAQMWLTVAALDNALALRRDDAERRLAS